MAILFYITIRQRVLVFESSKELAIIQLGLCDGGNRLVMSCTAKYIKVNSGYMGQLVEWPEVISEGKTIEECREMLKDALREMILAYKQQGREIPSWRRSAGAGAHRGITWRSNAEIY